MSTATISFAIVNWNGGEKIHECLASIERFFPISDSMKYEVVVVDNASRDLDRERMVAYHNLKLRLNDKNLLFATATNQSVGMCAGEFLFLLNNDVVLTDDLGPFLSCAVQDASMVSVPRLMNVDGTTQKSVRRLPTVPAVLCASLGLDLLFPRLDSWMDRGFNYTKDAVVEQPMFSAVFIPRSVWKSVGGLDEQFPLLFNDVDWFQRLKRMGGKCVYRSRYCFFHVHGMSVNKRPLRRLLTSSVSMMRYFYKHGPENIAYRIVATIAVCFSFGTRLVLIVCGR